MKIRLAFYIRTEASHSAGFGHLFRTLALAKKIKEAFKIKPVFLLSGEDRAKMIVIESGFFAEAVQNRGARAERDAILSRLKEGVFSLFAIDLARIKDYENLDLKRRGAILTIMNERTRRPAGDIIIDVLGQVSQNSTNRRIVLRGPAYQILREDFLCYRKIYKPRKELKDVFVTFGGSDPYGVTARILSMLGAFPSLSFTAVLGPAFRHKIKGKAGNIRIITAPDDMPRLMSGFDLAICGFGITSYELACLGVPAFIVGQVSSQKKFIREFSQLSGSADLGMYSSLTAKKLGEALEGVSAYSARKEMWKRARLVVDGRGAQRVVRAISFLVRRFL